MEKHIGKRAEVLLPQDLSVYLLILQDLNSVGMLLYKLRRSPVVS